MKRSQQGVSLIEVLVALVVFSIGLLGVANLQVFGLKMNANADTRTRVTLLAGDIVERMRANPGDWLAYRISFEACSRVAAMDPLTTTDLAELDKQQWCQRVARELPEARSSVSFDDGVGTVTIRWSEREGHGAGTNTSTNVSGQSAHELVVRARLSNA